MLGGSSDGDKVERGRKAGMTPLARITTFLPKKRRLLTNTITSSHCLIDYRNSPCTLSSDRNTPESCIQSLTILLTLLPHSFPRFAHPTITALSIHVQREPSQRGVATRQTQSHITRLSSLADKLQAPLQLDRFNNRLIHESALRSPIVRLTSR